MAQAGTECIASRRNAGSFRELLVAWVESLTSLVDQRIAELFVKAASSICGAALSMAVWAAKSISVNLMIKSAQFFPSKEV